MAVRGKREKAILVGVATRDTSAHVLKEHIEELGRLAHTAGADILDKVMQRRSQLDPSTLIGEGKVREIAELVQQLEADLVIFDDDLSGSQIKNLEKHIPVKILDRSGIILDIFAKHAKTAEAKIQVEVAQLEYLLPRLTRAWTHLSRQAGGVGIGMRGPGETQLEVDRRMIRKRIADLNRKLEKVQVIREAQHQHRIPTFHAAVVGYTNAGKSTLMNALTHAGVEAADKLFATLDPTTRKLWIGPGRSAVLSDTVGFIRKLPHGLFTSFKSTLSVALQASVIIHLVDASSDEFEEQMEITANVLTELGIVETPRLTVFNKIDLLDPERVDTLRGRYPSAIWVSSLERQGLDSLRTRLTEHYDRVRFEQGLGAIPGITSTNQAD
jgi:GTPase